MTSGRQVRNSCGLHLLIRVMSDEGKNDVDDQNEGVDNKKSEPGELGPAGRNPSSENVQIRALRFF